MPATINEAGAVVIPNPAATIAKQRSSLSERKAKRGRTPALVKKRLVSSSISQERRAIMISAAKSTAATCPQPANLCPTGTSIR